MSHQAGINANEELKQFFANYKDGKISKINISIENEHLILDGHKDVTNTWEKDFDMYVTPAVEENQPCDILYRLDDWLLISWSPDTSPIRQKILYASTKATLKQELGSSEIKEKLHGLQEELQ